MLRFVVPLLAFLLLVCFKIAGQSSKKTVRKTSSLILLAWNENTVHNYQFSLFKNGQFVYTIIEKDSSQKVKSYYGRCINKSVSDTLFLKYNKNKIAPGFKSYLVEEADGRYLIQQFIDSPKLIFLRLQQLGHRF
jgi:hypothetical protein